MTTAGNRMRVERGGQRMIALRSLLLASLAGASWSCGSPERDEPAMQVRDSAGIRIVESSAPQASADSGWTVSAEPVLELGSKEADPGQRFHYVEVARRLSDGRIVVAQSAPPALRWFDTTGTLVASAGRQGPGPGEFDNGEGGIGIHEMWKLPGDSIGTFEHYRRRLQVFDPAGRYVRSVVLELPSGLKRSTYPQLGARLDVGGFVQFVLESRREDCTLTTQWRDSATFLRFTEDGRFAGEISRLPAFPEYCGERSSRTGGTLRYPQRPPFPVTFAVAAHGDRFYYANTERYEIVAYDTNGSIRSLIRRTGPRRPVTEAMLDEYKRARMARARDIPIEVRIAEQELGTMPVPDSLPAFRTFRVDSEGYLWVQEYALPEAKSITWSVFSPDGRWASDVVLPSSWTIVDLGRDYILTVETNEDDVEMVRMYRLYRSQPRAQTH